MSYPVDCVWDTWSLWGKCDVTCGGGRQKRTRTLEGPFYGGADCVGPFDEWQDCNSHECPSKILNLCVFSLILCVDILIKWAFVLDLYVTTFLLYIFNLWKLEDGDTRMRVQMHTASWFLPSRNVIISVISSVFEQPFLPNPMLKPC